MLEEGPHKRESRKREGGKQGGLTFGQCSQEVMTQFSGRTVKERENVGQGRRKKIIIKINTIGKIKKEEKTKVFLLWY